MWQGTGDSPCLPGPGASGGQGFALPVTDPHGGELLCGGRSGSLSPLKASGNPACDNLTCRQLAQRPRGT